MENEKVLSLYNFQKNINEKKDFNYKYKKSYEREEHIITGECILNYLLENKYTKPFIKEEYMMKSDDNSYFQKLNIYNYKKKFDENINNNKNKPVPIENEIITRILHILQKNDDRKNNRHLKLQKYEIEKQLIKENKPIYLNTEGNKEIKKSFYEKYLLPKINFKEEQKQKLSEDNKNSFELNKGILKNTSINKTIEIAENRYRNQIFNKPINFYSSSLRRNIMPIFRNVNAGHSISVKKGKLLNKELNKIHDKKFSINSYTSRRKKKGELDNIKNIKITDKKYHLINLFKDLGKIKTPREIEKTLFNQEDKYYKKLRSKDILINKKK